MNIEAQIKALQKVLETNPKNPWAIKNKIKQLEKRLNEAEWKKYLAQ